MCAPPRASEADVVRRPYHILDLSRRVPLLVVDRYAIVPLPVL